MQAQHFSCSRFNKVFILVIPEIRKNTSMSVIFPFPVLRTFHPTKPVELKNILLERAGVDRTNGQFVDKNGATALDRGTAKRILAGLNFQHHKNDWISDDLKLKVTFNKKNLSIQKHTEQTPEITIPLKRGWLG